MIALRLAIAACAVALVGGAFGLLLQIIFPAPPEPARAPFGMSAREMPSQGNVLANSILALQGLFYQHMQGAMRDLRETGAAFWTLMGGRFCLWRLPRRRSRPRQGCDLGPISSPMSAPCAVASACVSLRLCCRPLWRSS